MAQELKIPGAAATVKIRNILAPALLPFITFFIYYFCWWYFINRELRDYGRARDTDELGTSPGISLLAVTLGALIIVPAIWSTFTTFKRIQAAQRLVGVEVLNGWIGLILGVVIAPALYAYMQSGLNNAWRKALV